MAGVIGGRNDTIGHFPRASALASVALFVFPIFCVAQQPPRGAEAGQAERQLQRLPEPTTQDAAGIVTIAAPAPQAPPGADSVKFRLAGIDLVGNTRISSAELLGPHQSRIGQQVVLTDIYAIAQAMSARYRDEGYILSTVLVPAQRIATGRVRLEVVEGFLTDVQVEGASVRAGLIASQKAALLRKKPLRATDLERFLLLLNDLPGVTAQGVLRASPEVAGGSELIVKVARERFSAEAGGNNRGSRLQGPNQLEASIGFNSLFGADEGTTLRYLGANPTKELQLFSLQHVERLSGQGLELKLSASHSEAQPDLGAQLSQFNLGTDTTQGRVELSYPLQRGRLSNLRVRGVLSYHDGKTEIVGLPLYADTIAAVRAGITWDGVDGLGGVNILDIEFSKGLSGLGASELNDPFASRPGGDPEFSKATYYLARLQSLSHGFSALLAINGQSAFTNLLSPEEFAFGGEQFGRAYDPSELVGDSGIAGKAELRYTQEFANRVAVTLYAFGEAGRVTRRLATSEAGSPQDDDATGFGGGLRFTIGEFVTGYVETAKPSNHPIAATGKEDARVFGGLLLRVQF